MREVYDNGETYKNIQNQISSEVKKIDFINIDIIEIVKVNNKFYTLLKVNKERLFNHIKNKFEFLDKEIDHNIKNSNKYSLLDQLSILNKETKRIKKALSIASVLNILDPKFDIRQYVDKYTNYLDKKSDLLHKITFEVRTDDIFANRLIEVLNQKNYKVKNHSDIKLEIKKNIHISESYGFIIAKVLINIKVLYKNKILNSISMKIKGIGNSREDALINASNSFKDKLKDINIDKLILK